MNGGRMIDRRRFLQGVAGAGLGGALPLSRAAPYYGPEGLPAGTLASATYDTLPGKLPLIKKSFRPPNYETPVHYFNEVFTPNDAFFVRYHLSNIPEVAADTWKLSIGGDAASAEAAFTLADLKGDFEQVEMAAVCQCSGNRRGLSEPHVPGVEWGYGAMGNARWKGVRLGDVLRKVGVKAGALEVAYDGADGPVNDKTPDFRKSIPVWKALDENTLLVYEMNGEPLPHWNGFPVRLLVAGWTATYWMKHLTRIEVRSRPLEDFWMNPAYRIPKGRFPIVDRFVSQETDTNTPITEMVVNSLITNIHEHSLYRAGSPLFIRGIAWDGGYGVTRVDVSTDGGRTWMPSMLGDDHGRFSFRQWTYAFRPAPGKYEVMARATNRVGATQTSELVFNPAGYHNNVMQTVTIQVR
ncbi:MAG: molybdopterin-dependent oxidoreductase [Betaproteobacteria bacterium]|nr:molybdopterin-dependent oxidoreductase [Betaproteobacteria bacterium]